VRHGHLLAVLVIAVLTACSVPTPAIPDASLQAIVAQLSPRADLVGVGLQDDSHLLVVAVHGPAIGVEDFVRGALPTGARFEIRHVAHSLTELNALLVRITAAEITSAPPNPNVTLVDVDELTGQVVIGVKDMSPDVAAGFKAKYGDAIVVQQESPGTLL
jgi:hypothetical protein